MAYASYYRYSIQQAPGLFFLKTYRARDFFFDFPQISPRVCEITYIQEGVLTEASQLGTVRAEAGTVYTHARDRICRHRSDSPVYHVFEIGLRFQSAGVPMTEGEVRSWIPTDGQVILPVHITDPKAASEVGRHVKNAVKAYQSPDRTRYLTVRAELAEIFRVMTAHAIASVHKESGDSAHRSDYCRAACDYVAAHLSQPIREQELADLLHITPEYFSRLFSRSMGMTLTEYVHRAKLRQVARLVLDGGANLRTAADAVGIASTKHLSRLFRQYMGMSITEYKKIHNAPELTNEAPEDPFL